jgi:hypothetical protein
MEREFIKPAKFQTETLPAMANQDAGDETVAIFLLQPSYR